MGRVYGTVNRSRKCGAAFLQLPKKASGVLVGPWDAVYRGVRSGLEHPKCPKVSCQLGQGYNYLLLFVFPQALVKQINNITVPNEPPLISYGYPYPLTQRKKLQ